MTGSPPVVDVVVLTWNDGELLDRALASVLGSEGVDVRVVVVDNGSEPPATVPADSRVRLIRNAENRGVRARNQGTAVGTSDLVAFVDSDVRLRPDTLSSLAGALVDQPHVALVCPVFEDQVPEASAGRAPTAALKAQRLLGLRDTYEPTRPSAGAASWDVDFSITACVLFRRSAFEAVGGLDEAYFYGPEDIDLCLRLKEAGWRIQQVAAATCYHPPRRRNRRVLSRRGALHVLAVVRHLWRHRGFRRSVPA
ncbi:MAG TPA: glycosyltransferase [Acidimicrobiales bacterium]|nr:glycosyltransferase [Acidimicrobiales bacterium]